MVNLTGEHQIKTFVVMFVGIKMILVKLRSVLAQQLSDCIITSEEVTLKLG